MTQKNYVAEKDARWGEYSRRWPVAGITEKISLINMRGCQLKQAQAL